MQSTNVKGLGKDKIQHVHDLEHKQNYITKGSLHRRNCSNIEDMGRVTVYNYTLLIPLPFLPSLA